LEISHEQSARAAKGFTAAAALRKVARMVKAFILIVEWAGTEHEY
jgi:hypothetical protein